MIYVITLSLVIVVLVGITVYKTSQVKNKTDFLVAGRTLSWPVLVFTLLSSWIGAGSILVSWKLIIWPSFKAAPLIRESFVTSLSMFLLLRRTEPCPELPPAARLMVSVMAPPSIPAARPP